MEEVKKEVQKYKTIKNGVEVVVQYKACDGKLFSEKKDAENHEQMLAAAERWGLIKTATNNIDAHEVNTWYFMDSQETIDIFMKKVVDVHHDYLNGYRFGEGNTLQVGDWVSFTTEYSDCSYDVSSFYTLERLKSQVDALWEKANAS